MQNFFSCTGPEPQNEPRRPVPRVQDQGGPQDCQVPHLWQGQDCQRQQLIQGREQLIRGHGQLTRGCRTADFQAVKSWSEVTNCCYKVARNCLFKVAKKLLTQGHKQLIQGHGTADLRCHEQLILKSQTADLRSQTADSRSQTADVSCCEEFLGSTLNKKFWLHQPKAKKCSCSQRCVCVWVCVC